VIRFIREATSLWLQKRAARRDPSGNLELLHKPKTAVIVAATGAWLLVRSTHF